MDIAENENDRRLIAPIRGDSSPLSSPDSAALLTPASTSQEGSGSGGRGDEDGAPADPLLRVGQDEVYELREGVGRGKSTGTEGLEFDQADYYDDGDDDMDASGQEDEDDIVYTADEERAVVRKFDRRLVLFVALLYLLSFLDRSSELSSLSFQKFPWFISFSGLVSR